jgi:hypothetical protein
MTSIARDHASTIGQVGSGAFAATTWGTAPTAGSTVLVFVQCVVLMTSVVDNGSPSRTFTLDVSNTNPDGSYIFRANNVQPSGTYTVTATPVETGHTIQAWGQSYLNVKAGSPAATNTGTATSTSVSSGAAAPGASGGLVFCGFTDDTGLNPETITFTGSAPQVEQVRNTNGSSYSALAVADALTGSSQTFTWTLGDSQPWAAVVAAYAPVTVTASSGLLGAVLFP